MSGGNLIVRFKAIGTPYAVWEEVDPGWIKLRTKRFGTADEIEVELWEELHRSLSLRRYVRSVAEMCEDSKRIGEREFDGSITKMYTDDEIAALYQKPKSTQLSFDWEDTEEHDNENTK